MSSGSPHLAAGILSRIWRLRTGSLRSTVVLSVSHYPGGNRVHVDPFGSPFVRKRLSSTAQHHPWPRHRRAPEFLPERKVEKQCSRFCRPSLSAACANQQAVKGETPPSSSRRSVHPRIPWDIPRQAPFESLRHCSQECRWNQTPRLFFSIRPGYTFESRQISGKIESLTARCKNFGT